jgi:3-hydroxybutyryl-CoA dehydrogenase
MSAARAGFRVLLEDVMPVNLHHAQEALRAELGPETLPNVAFVSTIEDAVRDADLAIDCVPDELESKLEIFCLLDRMAPPRTVLATPTTRLSIADLAACTYRAGQCVGIAVEASSLAAGGHTGILLRATSKTTEETVVLVTDFWSRLGFAPVFEADAAEVV